MKRWKNAARVILVVAPVAFVLAGAWFAWHVTTSSAYQESLRLFEEAGLPLSLRETAPSPVPTEENAAPLYLEAIALVDGTPDVRIESYADISPEISGDARRAVESASEALRLLHAAVRRPRCRFPGDYDDPLTASPFRAGNLLKLARLLAARATLRAEEGNLDGALDDLRALFRSARALRQEPMLLSQVVRLSIDDVGLAVLEVVLPQCAAAVPALERVELDDPRGAVAQGNRGAAGAAVETLLTPGAIDPDASGLARDDPLYWTLRLRSVTGPYLNSEAATYLDFLRKFSEALESGYPKAIAEAQRLESKLVAEGGLLIGTIGMRTAGLVRREGVIASRIKLALVAARCLDHRRQHGVYPETLSEVVSASEAGDPLSERAFSLVSENGALSIVSPANGAVSWKLPE